MTAQSTDLAISAAGLAQGKRGFQEFLLAGERHVVAGMSRPGAEARFAEFYQSLPKGVHARVEGYFRRQALLDLSQRVALLGRYVRIDIATPLDARTTDRLIDNPIERGEIDGLTPRRPADLSEPGAGAVLPHIPVPVVHGRHIQHIDLLLQEVTVEKSNDDGIFSRATDTVHLAVTSISETGRVRTAMSKLGSRNQGELVKFDDLVLASVPVDQSSTRYPRTFPFKIDAVEHDDGSYDEILEKVRGYVQGYVTQELIAKGIVAGGAWLGIPIPPQLANFLASYVKGWFDEAIGWLFGLFANDDDLIGTYTRTMTVHDPAIGVLSASAGEVASGHAQASGQETPFTHVFNGSGGRWRVKMCFRLR